MQPEPVPKLKSETTRANWAGLVAYFSFVPALVFLLIVPYRKNSFVRFHAVQCLLCWLIGGIVAALLRLLGFLLVFIPVVGPLLETLLLVIISFAVFLIWIVLLIKAFKGEMFPLPWIGAIAKQYSAAA
jgi:uncharacterized membrane protein